MTNVHGFDGITDAAVAWAVICVCILAPIALFSFYRFYKKRSAAIFRFRSKPMKYLFNCLCLICLLVERIIDLCVRVWHVVGVPVWVDYMARTFIFFGIFGIAATNAWILYYKQMHNQSLLNSAWKREIDPSEKDWYLLHRHTYGDAKYVLTRIFIPIWIIAVVFILLSRNLFGDDYFTWAVESVIMVLPLIVTLIIIYKAKDMIDTYHIRNELLIISGIMVACNLCFAIVFIVVQCQSETSHNDTRIEWLVLNVIGGTMVFLMSLTTTYFPLFAMGRDPLFPQQSNSDINILEMSINIPNRNRTISTDLKTIDLRFCKWSSVTHYETLFNLFCTFLLRGFAVENILFFIEVIQWKTWVIRHLTEDQKNDLVARQGICSSAYGFMMEFPKSIPTSIVVTMTGSSPNSEFLLARVLYDKYISENAQCEVNLGYTVRHFLETFFESTIHTAGEKSMGAIVPSHQLPIIRLHNNSSTSGSSVVVGLDTEVVTLDRNTTGNTLTLSNSSSVDADRCTPEAQKTPHSLGTAVTKSLEMGDTTVAGAASNGAHNLLFIFDDALRDVSRNLQERYSQFRRSEEYWNFISSAHINH